MCSMAVAEGLPAAGLVLLSYPLHPPGKPEKLRTEHLPALEVPCLFVAGTRDPFGTPEEVEAATAADPGTGHPRLARRRAPRPEGPGRGDRRRRGRLGRHPGLSAEARRSRSIWRQMGDSSRDDRPGALIGCRDRCHTGPSHELGSRRGGSKVQEARGGGRAGRGPGGAGRPSSRAVPGAPTSRRPRAAPTPGPRRPRTPAPPPPPVPGRPPRRRRPPPPPRSWSPPTRTRAPRRSRASTPWRCRRR